jgi:1-acyl-sn-glycerol-3-phosphate acyltransferase
MGGIPVDRSKNNNLTDQAVKMFDENDSLFLVFTPEGTRSYNPNWEKRVLLHCEKGRCSNLYLLHGLQKQDWWIS